MSNVLNFLTDLAVNPTNQQAFSQAPTAVMEAAGLSQSDQAILKSGHNASVAAAFADELSEPGFIYGDPGPDPRPDPDPPQPPAPKTDADSPESPAEEQE